MATPPAPKVGERVVRLTMRLELPYEGWRETTPAKVHLSSTASGTIVHVGREKVCVDLGGESEDFCVQRWYAVWDLSSRPSISHEVEVWGYPSPGEIDLRRIAWHHLVGRWQHFRDMDDDVLQALYRAEPKA